LNTRGYGGRTLKKTIKVHTDDTQHPVSDLTVTGEVKKYAIITPPRALLNGEIGETIKATLTVAPASKGLFRITGVKADQGKDVRVTLVEGKEPDQGAYTLLVENQRGTVGRYQDIIRMSTTTDAPSEIVIPVWGNITPPQIATIEPRHVALSGSAGATISRTVRIVPKYHHVFSITDAKAQNGTYIRWDVKETEESGKKGYTLTVENLKKEKGRYYDNILLKTDNKDMPEIRVSISGHITE